MNRTVSIKFPHPTPADTTTSSSSVLASSVEERAQGAALEVARIVLNSSRSQKDSRSKVYHVHNLTFKAQCWQQHSPCESAVAIDPQVSDCSPTAIDFGKGVGDWDCGTVGRFECGTEDEEDHGSDDVDLFGNGEQQEFTQASQICSPGLPLFLAPPSAKAISSSQQRVSFSETICELSDQGAVEDFVSSHYLEGPSRQNGIAYAYIRDMAEREVRESHRRRRGPDSSWE